MVADAMSPPPVPGFASNVSPAVASAVMVNRSPTFSCSSAAAVSPELGADYQASFGNLKTELEVKGKDITVKDANGKGAGHG